MIKIPLRYSDKFALIDSGDFGKVSKYNWFASRGYANLWYAKTYVLVNGTPKQIRLHRFILDLKPEDPRVDHKNGNGLDCRRSNMRLATQSQNMANSGLRINNKSGYKGVPYVKEMRKYTAQIRIGNGKRLSLGLYNSAVDAAKAYNKQATKYFGEFALLNEIPEGS